MIYSTKHLNELRRVVGDLARTNQLGAVADFCERVELTWRMTGPGRVREEKTVRAHFKHVARRVEIRSYYVSGPRRGSPCTYLYVILWPRAGLA